MADVLGAGVACSAVAAEEGWLNCAGLTYFEAGYVGANFGDDS
jgi:hypothetical protein